jgi:hypothetical protein
MPMRIRERLEAFWSGERPDRVPFTTYESKLPLDWSDPVIVQMLKDGLGVLRFVPTWAIRYSGDVQVIEQNGWEGNQMVRRQVWRTPLGEVSALWTDNWQQKYFLETAEDYRILTYIAKHAEYTADYAAFHTQEIILPAYMVPVPRIGRTPLQTILVDYAGLANFSLHLVEYPDELRELYEALLVNFRRLVEIAAAGPGRYINVIENFTVETLGPRRFKQYLLPVYEETFGTLHQAGKVVGCHYDGKIKAVKDLVANSPVDLIESLTPPPEGDITLAEARASWPDKLFWSNINLGCYELAQDELRQEIYRRVRDGAPDGRRLAFEVSEDKPARWRESMPVILAALNEIEIG